MKANISQTKEKLDGGKGTVYTSTLSYFGQPKNIAQMLKCQVLHEGYKKHQLEDEINLAEAQLNLSFKPDPNANITYLGSERKGEESKSRSIKVMFRANPQPQTGYWYIGNSVIPIDESGNISSHFKSSFFSDGDLEGEYQVTLNLSLVPRIADEKNLLSVTNDLGTTNYTLNLTTFLHTMQVRNTDLVDHSSTISTIVVTTVTLCYQEEEGTTTSLSYDPDQYILPSLKKDSSLSSNWVLNYALMIIALATCCCLIMVVSTLYLNNFFNSSACLFIRPSVLHPPAPAFPMTSFNSRRQIDWGSYQTL